MTNVGTLTVGAAGGTNRLVMQGGSLAVNTLVATRTNNTIAFSAGVLALRGATVSNGVPLVVGDGVQAATLRVLPGSAKGFWHGLTIASKATLTGSGEVKATTAVHGTLAPGVGIGGLTNVGPLALQATADSRFDLAAATVPGAGWDYLVVKNAALALGGKLKVVLSGGFVPSEAQRFVIISNTVPLSGSFSGLIGDKALVYTNAATQAIGSIRVETGAKHVALYGYRPGVLSLGTVMILR